MILVVSNVVYSSQYLGWTRGVDNATHFTCLLPGSVPAPVARVLSMDNAHNCRVEISMIPIVATFRSLNIIPLRKEHAIFRVPSIAMTTMQSLFTATAAPSSSVFLVTTQAYS